MALSIYTVLLLIFSIDFFVYSERLHEQIYSSIEGGAACFRRLNGTHQAGCSSSDNGAVGVVHMIKDVNDAQWLVQNSTAGPYMIVVDTALFYDVIELLMEHPALISGVLLYDNATNSASSFTQESRCPNEYSSASGSTCSSSVAGGFVWNKKGTGLLRRNIPFPMFYLPQSRAEEIDKIEKCYNKFNLDKNNQAGNPLCSLQLNSFMFAAVNSEVCLRRSASSALLTPTKVCDPLGDNNLYYSLFPRITGVIPGKPVTLVTARVDSASLFDGLSPGAASSVVGMVTLLTAATTLSQMIPVTDAHLYDQNVLWTLFNGESFDYVGSQRVAYDISTGSWPPAAPLKPADIRLHVEVGQIGGGLANDDSSWPFHAFVPYTGVITEITEFLNVMSSNSKQFNITVESESTSNLPPSSLHSFRRILKNVTESGELPELLLADHNNTFTNKYYQSALDEYRNINFNYRNITVDSNGTFIPTEDLLANGTMKETDPQVKISRFATVLARTIYQRVAGKSYSGNLVASAHLVDEMLYCFLRSQACRLIMAADYASSTGNEEKPPEKPAPLYVGVAAWPGTAPIFAGHLLALLTGTHLNINRTTCGQLPEPGFTQYWLRGWNNSGICVKTTMNISAAVSPAFIIPDYDLKSGVYSSWTESVWQAMWARVFVRASGAGARVAAVAGAVLTGLAAAATYWLKRHAARVFVNTALDSMLADEAGSGILRTVNC